MEPGVGGSGWNATPQRVTVPYANARSAGSHLEYHRTREIRWEAGPTTVQGELLVVTDSAQYREGTVKSTPARGVKEYLKPTASMQ